MEQYPAGSFMRHTLCRRRIESCYVCEDPNSAVLPWEMLEAAHKGDIEMIKDYIAKDNEVNALYEEDSLLSRACREGHPNIVALLLQCPTIHLNVKNQGNTPLMLALRNGHTECAKLLIDSTVACNVEFDHCSNGLAGILKMQPKLRPSSARRILLSASVKGEWEVAKLLLQTNHIFTKEDLYILMSNAANQDRWDVIQEFLKREFLGKDELLDELLAITVYPRCWERVQEILCAMSSELKLNIPFVEAVLGGRLEDVEKMFEEEKHLDSQTLNCSLLVAAAGGTIHSVAKFLMNVENTYTQRTFSDALFMAASGSAVPLFPLLLSNKEASYNFCDLSRIDHLFNDGYSNDKEFMHQHFMKYVKEHAKVSSGGFVE